MDIPSDYMELVKKVHSVGGFGSVGYGYDWKIEEARKNLLRTHTTAVSARMLYKLAKVCKILFSQDHVLIIHLISFYILLNIPVCKNYIVKKNYLRHFYSNLFNLQDGFKPVKYFSIDRVFRNETLDATHLAEFHQVEGVVADYGLTLGDLIGLIFRNFDSGTFTNETV